MAELKSADLLNSNEEVKVDSETEAAIQLGIRAADEGRTLPSDQVRKVVSEWISKFSTRNPR
jgi:predicted transcriptional regulator